MKRASNTVNRLYPMRFRANNFNQDDVKKILPSGYLTCDPVKDHTKEIINCYNKGVPAMVGCGLYPLSCRYYVANHSTCFSPQL